MVASKKFIMKELQGILLNLERACRKAERVSAKLDIPSLGELVLIKTQIEQLIELGKEK